MNKIQYPVVKVIWVDAESSDDWQDILGVNRECRDIETVGFLLEETDLHIVLSMNLDHYNNKCSMTMTIPNAWIKDLIEYE